MTNLCTQGASRLHKINSALYFRFQFGLNRWVANACAVFICWIISYAPFTAAQTHANNEFDGYSIQISTTQGFSTTPLPKHWQNQDRILTITAPYINLHTFAGRGYPIFHVLEQNDTVYLLKRRNDWFKIETHDGKLGWVARNDIRHTTSTNNTYFNVGRKNWRDHQKNTFELGLTTGSFDGAIAYTPYVGYHFTPNIQLEINYTQAFGDFSNLKSASLSLIHKPFPDWRITPFFKLSSGFIQTNPSTIIVQSVDRQDSLLTVGGGLFFYPSNRLVLRVEYDKHTILTTRDVNEEVEEWKAGFGVLF